MTQLLAPLAGDFAAGALMMIESVGILNVDRAAFTAGRKEQFVVATNTAEQRPGPLETQSRVTVQL